MLLDDGYRKVQKDQYFEGNCEDDTHQDQEKRLPITC
jgi:hypothetical protein